MTHDLTIRLATPDDMGDVMIVNDDLDPLSQFYKMREAEMRSIMETHGFKNEAEYVAAIEKALAEGDKGSE